jgi:hypothetical protein
VPEASFEEVAVISFKNGQAGVEPLTFGNDDDIEPIGEFIPTENLSYQTFSAISLDRSTQLFRRGDTEAADAQGVRLDEYRAVSTVNAGALFVNLLEFSMTADPLMTPEATHRWLCPPPPVEGSGVLFAADGQPLAALGAAALQHQTAVFRAHTHQKPVGFCAVPSIRLERAYSLSHDIPSE